MDMKHIITYIKGLFTKQEEVVQPCRKHYFLAKETHDCPTCGWSSTGVR